MTTRLGIPFIYKSSFDKANRSSHNSARGVGLEAGLRILERVKTEMGVPVLTDVHEDTPMDEVASVVDVLQTPAFLCRQTNFIQSVARTGKPVNIKKGQFLAPWDMGNVVEKARATGNQQIMVCERGYSFGYNNLVSDMRSLAIMRDTQCPVVFDATHSVQLPGGQGSVPAGNANTYLCWRVRQLRSALLGYSWNRTPTRQCPERWPEFMADGSHGRITDHAGRVGSRHQGTKIARKYFVSLIGK
jgi:3-deoxy-D-manno-octulosonic acid (KDO) 8-phosphate synthase